MTNKVEGRREGALFKSTYSICLCSGRRLAARGPLRRRFNDTVGRLAARHSAFCLGLDFLAVGRCRRTLERVALVSCLFPMDGISPCRITLFFPEGVCTFFDPLIPSFCHR